MSKIKRLPERTKVKEADTWDLSSLYKSDAAWKKDLAKLKRQTAKFESFRDGWPKVLKSWRNASNSMASLIASENGLASTAS